MADTDDWGGVAISQQPKADDWGGIPVEQPKIPDMSSAQKMATDNLAVNDNKTVSEGGEPKPPQTPQERLDTATGMSIQAVINGTAKPSDVPQAVREDYNNHVKAGTVNNFGSYMQLMLHNVVPLIAGIPQRDVGNTVASWLAKTGIYIATSTPSSIGSDIIKNTINLPVQGATVLAGAAYEKLGGELSPEWAARLTQGIPEFGQNKDTLKLREALDNKVNYQPTTEAGKIAEGALGIASYIAGGEGSLVRKAAGALATGAGSVAGGEVAKAMGFREAGQRVGQILGGTPGMIFGGTKAGKPQFAAGEGPWDNHPGADIIKPDIAKQVDKEHSAVTSDDFDQTIARGSKNLAPEGKDFRTVATAMSGSGIRANMFHGSDSESIEAVNTEHHGTNTDAGNLGSGFYASPSNNVAFGYGKNLHNVNMRIDNPLEIVRDDNYQQNVADAAKKIGVETPPEWSGTKQTSKEFADEFREKAMAAGYDGAVSRLPNNAHDIVEAVSYKPENVKMGHSLNIEDTLHEIYEKTGIHPDQVFKDAQADRSIAEDISNGKIPAAYNHLLDTRPPIPNDVSAAIAHMDALSKEESSIDLSKEGASPTGLLSAVAKIFNPTGQSEAAGEMATALRQGRGPVAQYVAQIQDGLSGFAKTISGMSDAARLKFIDYIENRSGGATLDDEKLQPLADKIRDVYEIMAEKIGQLFPDVKMRQDYFTHQYTDEAKAAKFFSDWAAKQGSERNLQPRVFPTLQEAMAAGLEPRTTNPIDTLMSYVTNIGKLESAQRSLNLAREAGIAEFFNEGQQPEGWVPLGGKLASEGGKLLYAPEDAARVYNNDISKGFTGPVGEVVDAVGRVNNFNNMLMLSLSAYHATVTTLSSMAKDVGRALTQGSLTERTDSLLSTVTPLKNTLQGGKLIDAYLGREELSPEMQKTMDALVKNNAINIRQQEYWKAGPAKTYIDVFQHGGIGEELGHAKEAIKEAPITGTAKVIANEVGRAMNTVSAPLFEHYIPRIKLAASFNEMHSWMKAHPEATVEEVDKVAQDIGNSADNAFGEMNRDNLFWHNITRQTLQTAFLSYSWITGAARMLQGIPDIGKTIMGKQELTSNARYLMGMAATYAAINGVRTYLGTGHAPDHILDFIYPRTGGTTPEGKEERALLPSHIGQYTQYLMHGIGELGNEASPTLKLLYHLLSNSDFRGLPITNSNNSWFEEQRWNDYAHYALGEETPIGLKTFITGKARGSELTPVERSIGVRQAPREITDPEGQKSMMKRINDTLWKKKQRSDVKQKAKYEPDEED